MRVIHRFSAAALVCLLLFSVGCQTGADSFFAERRAASPQVSETSSAAIARESQAIARDPEVANAVTRKVEASDPAPPSSEVRMAAAQTEPPVSQPTLITLQPDEELNQHLTGAHRRVVLDFYADWCGPCRKQGKVLEGFRATATEMNTLIVKVDIDKHPDLAKSLSVEAVPTMMVVGDGQILKRRTGLIDAEQLAAWIQ